MPSNGRKRRRDHSIVISVDDVSIAAPLTRVAVDDASADSALFKFFVKPRRRQRRQQQRHKPLEPVRDTLPQPTPDELRADDDVDDDVDDDGAMDLLLRRYGSDSAANVSTARAHPAALAKAVRARFVQSHAAAALDGDLMSALSSYSDVLYCQRSAANAASVHAVVSAHCVNHVLRLKRCVDRHTAVIQRANKLRDERITAERIRGASKAEIRELRDELDMTAPTPEYRDSGFTRCRVLILLPTAHVAYQFVQTMLTVIPARQQSTVTNRERFVAEFAPTADDRIDSAAPPAYRHLFDGKTSDAFRMGIAFEGGRTVKLYADFYNADIIVASPLGLRIIVGSAEDSIRESDFLSSIDIAVVDCADVLTTMQNVAHLDDVVSAINKIPFKTDRTDFSRLRAVHADGRAATLRQTVLLSEHVSAELMALTRRSVNAAEHIVIRPPMYDGVISLVPANVTQTFRRLAIGADIATSDDDKLADMSQRILPSMRSRFGSSGHCLVYAVDYFDFVRLSSRMRTLRFDFVSFSEYSDKSAADRAVSAFTSGRTSFLLVSERAHFFRRLRIRSVQHVIMFGAPKYPAFYLDLIQLVTNNNDTQSHGDSLCLFTRLEAFALERIIGTARVQHLLQGDSSTHSFN